MALLENKLGKLAMEIEILKNKKLEIARFLQESMIQKNITAFEIMKYYRIVLWDILYRGEAGSSGLFLIKGAVTEHLKNRALRINFKIFASQFE